MVDKFYIGKPIFCSYSGIRAKGGTSVVYCLLPFLSSGLTSETGRIIILLVDQFRVFGVLRVLSLFTNAIV
ncbi:hypothetical protein D4S68_05890 [Salmonella enterica]|uniref:Uncharacterized protein n=3 Tax=Salmonella enterica I TaxID=59201 RepID=A0A5U9JEV4_SALDE|nr:hypothetical protein C1D15_21685 [Salmonella enterica subsp. enterica serovar Kentucky]AVD47325.1 hypothetical protein C4I14_13570 [Salmonella enterica subsp. enterica serovar Derby]EAA5810888.1 hypothetical protein [Salmonella enterica subsp. enterica]EAA8898258.1 hypothetical protein [Salmonella enterica]EBC9850845.1 hypothetical protein [Salmonella enterica subsp. enterica serovar Agama]EBS6603405.1 hypothetical protein [Salmonella enterica subsp. enterica serovar Indiana]ECB3550187.1 h